MLATIVAGSTHDAEEVNRRVAKNHYNSFKSERGEEFADYKLRFEETYRRYLAAGNPTITEDEQARDFLWNADRLRYGSARDMLLNRKDPEGNKIPLPTTVAVMYRELKEYISSSSIKFDESNDPLAFVYQINTHTSNHRSSGGGATGGGGGGSSGSSSRGKNNRSKQPADNKKADT